MSSTASVGNTEKSVRKTGSRRNDNVRQRGKTWQVRLTIAHESLVKTFDTKDEALLWLDLKRGERLEGDLGAFHRAQQLTLRSAILQYRDHLVKTQAGGAVQQDLSRFKCLAALPGTDIPLLEVLSNEVETIFAALKAKGPKGKPLSNNSIRLYYAALSAVYKHFITGEKWQFLPNPLSSIKRPPPDAPRSRRLVDDEEERIVSALTEYGAAYALTFMLLISTTMRMGELFALTWDQFDAERSRMNIKVSKTGERECPLSIESIELLSRLPRNEDRVIPITRDAFEMAWKVTMPRLNIKNLRRHDMRREGLTRWGQRGIDVVNLMKISGHKTMSQAQKYLNGTTDEAIDAMNGKLANDPYLKHRAMVAKAPKPSMLRHFFADTTPSGPGTPASSQPPLHPSSNVVRFPRAQPRAMASPTRRIALKHRFTAVA